MSEHRFCYLFEVNEADLAAYQRAHDTIPEAVPAAMRRAGVTSYSLFRRGTLVVAFGTCSSPVDVVFARLDADPDNAAWSGRIRRMMPDPLEPDGSLRFAAEIWRMPVGPPVCRDTAS